MAGSPFLELAEHRDLDYAERVAPTASGGFPFPHGEPSELVGGVLPGGYEGIVARLRRYIGDSETPTEFTFVVTRIPESLDFAQFIRCFEAGFRGVAARVLGPGGLGWIREYTFESIAFNRRYRIAMLRTGKEERLRQLFSPTFLDWMAHTAPEGLYFDLVSGILTVTLAGDPAQKMADVEYACELAGHIAERIRSEALEGTLGDARPPEADAARAAAEAKFAGQIQRAGFQSPPTDVATALAGLGPVIRHLSLHGRLPALNADGALVVFADMLSMSSRDGLTYRPALEIEPGTGDSAFVHILPRTEGDQEESAFGGFSIALGDGARRETESTRQQREQAEALEESLGGRFHVVADSRGESASVSDAARAWIASGAGGALILEAGRLTLVGASRPVLEWSFETLDEFSESVAPVTQELAVRS